MAVSSASYRQAMARFATGVTVITTRTREQLHGMTANAVTSVSLDPPTLLVVVGRSNETHELIPRSGAFVVNVLTREQRPLAEVFAVKNPEVDPFEDVAWQSGWEGQPFLTGSLARIFCTLKASHAAGDHTIYVGEVKDLAVGADADPLVYFKSRYTTVSAREPLPTEKP